MRRFGTLSIGIALCSLLLVPGRVSADALPQPPAGSISKNVKFVANVPLPTAISINFIGSTMFVSTAHGLYSFDVSDPSDPQLLGSLPLPVWENEDMDVDPVRHLAFISRDPRGFTTPATEGSTFPYGAVHIVDVSDPSALRELNVFLVPAGHTTTCVDRCRYVWTAGPYANPETQPAYVGRPIYATDIRDPLNPKPCPHPIDTHRNDGVTDYVHDVQVDHAGVAWVSGEGGVRGYWTSGRHFDPLTGATRIATGCNPIPYAGGGSPQSATPTRFMHNAYRDLDSRIPGDPSSRGKVLFATEENVVTDCTSAGRLAAFDLRGSLHGEGWRNIKKTHFRMRVLDTWTPERQPGSNGCASAHYFQDLRDGVLVQAFYTQGTRFLDVSDPRHIRQIGYYRPDDADTWAPYPHDGYVYVADFQRGVDVLRFTGRAGDQTRGAPVGGGRQTLRYSGLYHYLCVIRPR
jgi:hypothetical protein